MAVGKPMAQSAALYGQGSTKTPDIEMPPLGYNIDDMSNNSVSQEVSSSQSSEPTPLFEVPVQVPEEVVQEMESQQEVKDVVSALEEKPVSVKSNSSKSAQENFKELRLAKEKAERERDALMQQMMAMYNQQKPEGKVSPVEQIEEDISNFSIDEDALVEGKHVKKVVNEIKNLKSQLKSYQNQTKEMAIESKIKNDFPDFEKVVSVQNVEILNQSFPEIAQSLKDTQDLYNKAAAAYRIIKTFGIHKDIHEVDRARAIANAQKPRPLASVSPQQGDSPLSKANAFANGMTPELKEQLRKEMAAARKAM